MVFEKNHLYNNYNYLVEKYSKGIYFQLFCDYTPKSDIIVRKLFPRTLNEQEKRHREDLVYLYLWDILFYPEYDYKEDIIWQNNNHKDQIIKSIQDIIKIANNSFLQDIIFRICYHWPELRRLIFKEDYITYENCKSVEDYVQFIETKPNTYKELLYAARYQLSLLSNTPFTEIQDVFTLFSDSELIPVHEVKSRCKSVGPFNVIFSSNLLTYPKVQDEVINLLREIADNSSQTDNKDGLYISDSLTKNRYHLLSNPDSYDALMKIITNNCSFQLVTNYQAESFCRTLTQMTSLKFRLPRLIEIKDYCKSNSGSIPEWCYDDDSIIINEGKTVLRDTEQCYATFRLVVDN